jgi:hypothetical protein
LRITNWATALCLILTFCLAPPARAQAGGELQAAPDDSLATVDRVGGERESRWGPIPARTPASTGQFANRPRPGWEQVLIVPYRILGIPFEILGTLGYEGLKAADELGWFAMPPAEHMGLQLPGEVYLLPEMGLSDDEGFTYGAALNRFDLFTPGDRIRVEAVNSTKRAVNLALGTYFPLRETTNLQLAFGYADHPLTKFYGTGPFSRSEDLSYYNRESLWLAVEADQELGGGFGLEMRAFYSRVGTHTTRYNVHQRLEAIHAGRMPVGFDDRSHGMTYRLGILHDTTCENGRPESGGFQKLSISRFFADDGSDLEYTVYRADVEHFFPLWHTKRVLAVRGFYNQMDTPDGVDLPLTRAMTFARPDILRGYNSDRWLGNGTVGLSAEYRWPIWAVKDRPGAGLDAYLFSDVGQVFLETRDIGWNQVQTTGGFGLRLVGGDQSFVGRFEFGVSNEEPLITVKFSQTFQYDKRGLLSGKDPTRRR